MPDLPKVPVPPVLSEKKRRQDSTLFRVFALAEDWYDGLTRRQRDAIDQTLHFAAGFWLGLIFPGWVSWAICHDREFRIQLPIQRIDDTARDSEFWLIGTAVGWTARWTALVGVLIHFLP
jgi:hypothetical protein